VAKPANNATASALCSARDFIWNFIVILAGG